jgi:hypothetical protein
MPLSPEEIAATLAANERYKRSERRTTLLYTARNVLVALALAKGSPYAAAVPVPDPCLPTTPSGDGATAPESHCSVEGTHTPMSRIRTALVGTVAAGLMLMRCAA